MIKAGLMIASFFFIFLVCISLSIGAENLIPKRIISLGPTITEKLYLLGADEHIVGVTTYCLRPPQAQTKERIGNVIQVNLEKVVSLNADIIFATSLTEHKTIKKFRDLGLKVMVFNEPRSFAEMNRQFLELAKITGKAPVAREIIQEAEKKVSFIRKKTEGHKKPRVFVQIGTNPLFTATRDSFLNDFVEFAGGINTAGNATRGFYSREQVLKENPDIILIVAMEGMVAEKEKTTWTKFSALKAVKNNAIYIMDPYRICSPTPVTFSEALQEIAQVLHPDL